MPTFDLPNYEGIEVEEEKVIVDEKEVDEVLDRIRGNMAENVVIAENRAAKDGEIAVIDFAAYENGEPLEGVSAENFQMTLGDKQALEDFEALVKSITVGEAGEGDVTFPEDFINPEFAGKTVTMKVTVHAIQEKKLPELNDELAKKAGGFDSIEKMREAVVESYKSSRLQLNKSQAQKTMLDSLLKTVDFPLPSTMVDGHVDSLIQERIERLERQGKSIESLGKTPEELQAEVRPEAEEIAKTQVFLIAVAKKEGVEVADQEVDMQLHQIAQRAVRNSTLLKITTLKTTFSLAFATVFLLIKQWTQSTKKLTLLKLSQRKKKKKKTKLFFYFLQIRQNKRGGIYASPVFCFILQVITNRVSLLLEQLGQLLLGCYKSVCKNGWCVLLYLMRTFAALSFSKPTKHTFLPLLGVRYGSAYCY
jgi:trigger factor